MVDRPLGPGQRHRYPTELMTTASAINVASEWPPQWRDADGLRLREYGDTPRIDIEGQLIRCRVTEASKFVLWFVPTFGVLFIYFVYPTVESPKVQTLFLVMAPLSLISLFAITYGFLRYHEGLGDYIVIDQSKRSIQLPRYGQTFDIDSVVCFQFISGYREPFHRNLRRRWSREFNLLVNNSGYLTRYHVIGNPRKRTVNEIAEFSGISIVETTCPSGFFLCSDANGDG